MADIEFDVETHQAIFDWIRVGKNFLVFTGRPGAGKTYLCAALYKYCYDKFSSKRYWLERKFLARAREAIGESGDYIDNMQFYCDDELIILDDFGSCGFTEWRKEIWQSFLDYRYQNNLPTILTTNLSKEEIEGEFHPRFASRLFAKENLIIEVNDKDYRIHGK